MKKATKIGDKTPRNLTASGFFGSTGIEYTTLQEAIKANPSDKFILVKNKEYGGAEGIEVKS